MEEIEERLAKAEEANRALIKALLPFALVSDREDLKAAILAAEDGNTFELGGWFERQCSKARYTLHSVAPSAMVEYKRDGAPGLQ